MSFDDLVHYCMSNMGTIYVRAQIDGKWRNVPLEVVPFKQAMELICVWNEHKQTPARLFGETR